VLAKIPDPTLRAQAEAAFKDPASADALVAIGAGALAQSDINRKYDELKLKEETLAEDYTKLNGWYAEKKGILAEYDTLKARTPTDPLRPTPVVTPPAAIDTSKLMSKEEFFASMIEQQRSAANYLGLQQFIADTHRHRFNEVIDPRELLADKSLGKQLPDGRIYGLEDAYRTKYGDKLQEYQTKQEETRINALVDAKYAERMRANPGLPMPIRGGGSPLDALEVDPKTTAGQYTAEAAAMEYDRLQQSRQTV
jgi:hypothetical protein